MRRQFAGVIWLSLIVMSVLSVSKDSIFFSQLLLGNIEPMHAFMLGALILFPIYFYILAVNDQQSWFRRMLYLLGFIFGGYLIFLLETLNKTVPQPLTSRKVLVLAAIDVILIILFVFALLQGDWQFFLLSYRSDRIVYVMTWNVLGYVGVVWTKVLLGMSSYFKSLFT